MKPANEAALDAFIKLIAEKGFADVALRDVAEAAGLGLAELYRVYPDKVALVAAFLAKIDAEVLAGTPTPQRSRGDGARSAVRRHDAPLRRAQAVPRGAGRDPPRRRRAIPCLPWRWDPALRRSMAAMLEAASVPSEGLGGALRQNGLLAIHYAVSRVYDKDETTDLSKTMAALDSRLKTAERWAQLFEKYVKSPETKKPQNEANSPAA